MAPRREKVRRNTFASTAGERFMVTKSQRRYARSVFNASGKVHPGNAKKRKRQLRAAGLTPRKRRKK